jgi:dihydroorotate dehydrogenase (fumarate)
MAQLSTTYMGIQLKNPVIAGASAYTMRMDSIKKIDEAGAAALVISSLFEEQVQVERFKLEEDLEFFDNRYAEMANVFPEIKHAGPREHLMWVRKTKETVKIPVIASLNAVNRETWVEYAKLLQDTGIDGLELNFYWTPRENEKDGSDVEKEQLQVLREVKKGVKIPVSVKLSVFYSNPLNFIKKLDDEGADGFVLFNRLFEPDMDVKGEKYTSPFNFSTESDNRVPLRFSGLLFGNLKGDVCASSGIFQGKDVAKMILAGARCVQVVSTLFRNKIPHLAVMVRDLAAWMDEKGYRDLDSFRGRMSRKNTKDPWIYTRSQYVRLLANSSRIMEQISKV